MKGGLGKFGTIFLALALCLAVTGAGFAAWTDNLTIEGDVTTGDVCYEFVSGSYFDKDGEFPPPDQHPSTWDWTCDPNITDIRQLDKNVGWTTGVLTDEDGDTHLDLLTVVLYNTYPCYYNEISVTTHYYGTIPVRIQECTLTYPDPVTGDPVTVALPDSELVYIPGNDQYGGISNVIEIKWLDGTGKQLHNCDELETSFKLHVLQPAMQNATYTFSIAQSVIQWNEYTP